MQLMHFDGKNDPIAVHESTCLDFVYFRQLLRDSRKSDDNINHRINKVNSTNTVECKKLWEEMKRFHTEREQALAFCQIVLRDQVVQGNLSESLQFKKEVYSKSFDLP
jgi:hypothetical protein